MEMAAGMSRQRKAIFSEKGLPGQALGSKVKME